MGVSTLNSKTRELARSLLDYEGAGETPALLRVSEKLRRPLTTLTGGIGFRALQGRALTLAKAQLPNLTAVEVKPDGSLDGLNGLRNDEAEEAGITLIAHLLGLLGTFIGEDLMLHLVRDVWPNVTVDGVELRRGKENAPAR
jgi:hypothetical protein